MHSIIENNEGLTSKFNSLEFDVPEYGKITRIYSLAFSIVRNELGQFWIVPTAQVDLKSGVHARQTQNQ